MLKRMVVAAGAGWLLAGQALAFPTQSQPRTQCGLGALAGGQYSASGNRVFSRINGSGMVIWDAATAEVLRTIDPKTSAFVDCTISADGNRVFHSGFNLQASSYVSGEYDVETGRLLRSYSGSGNLRPLSDGVRLLVGYRIYNRQTGAVTASYAPHANPYVRSAISADEARVVSCPAGGSSPAVWSAATGTLVRSFTANGVVKSVDIDPTGTRIAFVDADGAKLYNVDTGNLLATIPGAPGQDFFGMPTTRFAPTGSCLVACTTTTYFGINPTDGSNLFDGDIEGITALTFSPDGASVAIGGWNRTLNNPARIEVAAIPTGWRIARIDARDGNMRSLSFSATPNRILAAVGDNQLAAFQISDGQIATNYTGHWSNAYAVGLTPDNDSVLTNAYFNGRALLWNARSGALQSVLGNALYCQEAAVARDTGRLFAGMYIKTGVESWEPDSTPVGFAEGQDGAINFSAMAPRPDGNVVAACYTPGPIRIDIMDFPKGDRLTSLTATGMGCANALAWNPAGTLLLSGHGITINNSVEDPTARIWNPATGALVRTLPHTPTQGVVAVAFSPDGTLCATACTDGSVRVWDTATGSLTLTFNVSISVVGYDLHAIAFEPGTGHIIVNLSSQTELHDKSTGALLSVLPSGHASSASNMTVSNDGRLLATCGLDGRALIYENRPPRAVIVAGGGSYTGNGIAAQTDELGAYAYRMLRARGYAAADIRYLSAFAARDADGDGLADTPGNNATAAALQDALTGPFAQDAGRIMVLMVDHGYRVGDWWGFRINPNEIVGADEIDTWLDQLQQSYPVDVTLVADACYSGRLVEIASGAPAGRRRIVAASTGPADVAVFLPPPGLSGFMQTFLSSAYMGNNLGEAFRSSQEFFQRFPVANQLPMIDDGTDNNGVANSEYFGATWTYGVQAARNADDLFPVLASPASTTVTLGQAAQISIRTLEGTESPTTITVAIRTPAPEVLTGDPVTTLPVVTLSRSGIDPLLWTGTVDPSILNVTGVYTLTYAARYQATDRTTRPEYATITVGSNTLPDPVSIHAVIGIGGSSDADVQAGLRETALRATDAFRQRFLGEPADALEYLGPHVTPALVPLPLTKANLTSALSPAGLPADLGRFYVHLAGDAGDAGATSGALRLDDGSSLTGAELDGMLDTLQSAYTSCTVILVVDMPQAALLTAACASTGNQSRVLIAGSGPSESAIFLASPAVSFTTQYLGAAVQGVNLRQAWSSARDFLSRFARSSSGLIQTPQLADGTALTTLATSTYLGRRDAYADDSAAGLPFVRSASFISGSPAPPLGTAVLDIELLRTGALVPSRVVVQLTPVAGTGAVALSRTASINADRLAPDLWTWRALVQAPTTSGTYGIAVWAEYDTGSGVLRTSVPQVTTLTVDGSLPLKPAKLDIAGRGRTIVSGDFVPSTTDGTNFGNVSILSSRDLQLRLSNIGDQPLAFTGSPTMSVSSVGTQAFVVADTPPPSLDPAMSYPATIQFAPPGIGEFSATVFVPSSDPSVPVYTFGLTGVGTLSCDEKFGCWVDRQYLDILQRDPDPVGRQYYVDRLCASTATLENTAAAFLFSQEFQNTVGFVARCYMGMFNNNLTTSQSTPGYRIPDRAGLLYWAGIVRSLPENKGREQVVKGFSNTPEWDSRVGNRDNPGYVDFLYNNILGRVADPAGKAYWVSVLDSGTKDRDDLALQFLDSPEAVAIYKNRTSACMAYLGFLDRAAEPAGFAYHAGLLDRGTSINAFLSGFLHSTEYQGRLTGLFCQDPALLPTPTGP